jgi:hypothetical protein
MKKLILMSVCVFSLNTITTAQEVAKDLKAPEQKGGKTNAMHDNTKHEVKKPEERAQKSVDQLNTTVGLTDDQKTKIQVLALTRVTKIDAIREKFKGQEGSHEAAKKEIMTVKKEYRQSTKALLTPEQLEKLKAKAQENGHDKGKGHNGKVKDEKQTSSGAEDVKKENESFGDED